MIILHKTKNILIPMIVVAFFGLMLCPASAEEKGVMRVSFTQFVPWKTILPDKTLGGIDIDLLRMMAERMDLELKVTSYPWKRGLEMLRTGEVDVLSSLLRRPEREEYAHFIEPPYVKKSNKAFFVPKGKKGLITGYDNLQELRIGVFAKNHYFKRFDEDTSLQKYPIKTTEQMFKMLLADRIDTFIMTTEVGEFKLREFGFDDRIVKARYQHTKPIDVHLALSKRSPLAHRRDEMSTVLKQLIQEGAVEQLKEKYLGRRQP